MGYQDGPARNWQTVIRTGDAVVRNNVVTLHNKSDAGHKKVTATRTYGSRYTGNHDGEPLVTVRNRVQ